MLAASSIDLGDVMLMQIVQNQFTQGLIEFKD